MSFSNKVVLVTGGSSGIGASIAVAFAKEGANVVIVGRNLDRLNAVAEKCAERGPNPLIITSDIKNNEEPKRIVQRTIEVYGKIDVLINNAGILRIIPILDTDYMESFDEVMKTNLYAVANLTHLAAPYLVESKGVIINISSVGGSTVRSTFSAYSTSKAALDHFTRATALELSTYGVRVNAICPGPVLTEIFNNAGIGAFIDDVAKETALGGASDPEEVAELALFLSSDKARSITGSLYFIDRGFMVSKSSN